MTGNRDYAALVVETIANAPNVEHVNPAYRFNLITSDPDDNKFVDCAVTAGATYILFRGNPLEFSWILRTFAASILNNEEDGSKRRNKTESHPPLA